MRYSPVNSIGILCTEVRLLKKMNNGRGFELIRKNASIEKPVNNFSYM